MNIKEHIPTLLDIIGKAQKNSLLELEVIIKQKITSESFENVIKKIKGIPDIKLNSSNEILDIFIENSNKRFSVIGSNSINKYCKTNNLVELKDGSYIMIKKSLVHKLDVNNYNLRFNLKKEEQSPITDISNWYNLDKFFRYKKRFSYITLDNLISFDFTIVKTSKKEIIFKDKEKKQKKNVNEFLKKFVIRPKNIKTDKDFNKWWKDLNDTDTVEIRGKKEEKFKYSKSFETSGVMESDIEYEIEIEWLGNKLKKKTSYEQIMNIIIKNLGIVLQGIQKSNFLIDNVEKEKVKTQYIKLMNLYKFKFSAPQNITLEHKHIKRNKYVDYNNILSIRRNYSVTEKADGERNICIILDDDSVYLINRKNEIKSLGCIIKGFGNTILDGELILKDKYNKNIILFAVFDIYVYKKENLKDRILKRTDEEVESNIIKESRNEVLSNFFTKMKVMSYSEEDNIMFIKKKFYYGNLEKYDRDTQEEITKVESSLDLLDKDSKKYKENMEYLDKLKCDMNIFYESKKVLDKEYIYNIDGLVFTPVNLVIGDEIDNKEPRFDGRWNKLFKWKPPEENTIDFKVTVKQEDGEDEIKYSELNGRVISYKTLILNVGYSPSLHTKHNSCRVMNEELVFNTEYSMVPFQPSNPYIQNIELAYVPIRNNAIFTENLSSIKSNMIVEFSYDKRMGEGFCWKPLRIRNNLFPNDFITAINVWRTIHNPITLDMIKNGDIFNKNDEEVYYFNNIDRNKRLTKPMADFHSYIKKTLIKKNSKRNDKMIDFACGKGGDLNHWLDSKLGYVVGLDVNRDNLENINNGLCTRIMTIKSGNKTQLLNNIIGIWADSSKLISNGVAAKDDLNKYYLDIIYGNVDSGLIKSSKLTKFYNMGNDGFEIGSSQFSFHYFFENEVKLDIFLRNVSKSIKKGGKFVGTCLDGRKVFELLGEDKDISVYENDILLWKINKLYDDKILLNDSRSVGMPIDIYVESIGNTTKEWLVNFEYLKTKTLDYDLKLKELKGFDNYFNDLKKVKTKYGDSAKMNDKLKAYSFLNTTFTFEKI